MGLRKKMRFVEVDLFWLWLVEVIVWFWATIIVWLAFETVLLVCLLKLERHFEQSHLQRCQQGILESFR
jgi:hypothetical protein